MNLLIKRVLTLEQTDICAWVEDCFEVGKFFLKHFPM